MALTFIVECFDDGHVTKAHFLLGIIGKLCQPLSELVFLIDVRRRERIFALKRQIDLFSKPFSGTSSLTAIPILCDMITCFVDRRKRE